MPLSKLHASAAVSALALVVSLVGAGGTASAAAKTDSGHPFSDPVWWPLRTPAVVDCTKSNPGCTKHHSFYGIDMLSKDRDKTSVYNKTAGVFAMGGGIAHIGDGVGRACGKQYESTTFGKWVWVDHGGGVISKYGHLSKIEIKEGQLVGPDTRLGTVGNTGIKTPSHCHIHYVDFLVKFPGIYGPSVGREFSRSTVGTPDGKLLACGLDGKVQVWPDALPLSGNPTRIEGIAKGLTLPATGDGCRSGAPATANKPGGVRLATAGAGALKSSWTKAPSGVDEVRLELGEYHPSTPGWDAAKREKWTDLSTTTTSYTHKSLTKKKNWRVRVWFHTPKQGWSAASSWVEKKTT